MGLQDVPMVSDALCIQVMYSALRELGFNEECVEIKVNHSKLLRGILSCCRIPAHLHSPLKNILLDQVSAGMFIVDNICHMLYHESNCLKSNCCMIFSLRYSYNCV